MSFGEYLAGSIELLIVLAALGFGAVRLRRRLLGGWSGTPARLAEVILGLSLLVVVCELVGVVGLYEPGWVLAAAVVAGVGVGLAVARPGEGIALPAPPVGAIALAVAIGAALLVTAHWAMPTQVGLDIGMYLPNTTWHNAPFAARFVQEGQVGALHMTEVLRLTVWFYPQNSELLHSVGILFLDSDFLSPLMNIGFMGLCLLAAWSFGRPYGAAATALLGVAVILDAEMLLLYQPGDAKNDTIGLFFLLASAAILVNGDAQSRAASGTARTIAGGPPEAGSGERGSTARGLHGGGPGPTPLLADGALIVAALAAGLALGTKLNLLAPFGLLTLGVIAVSPAGRRLRTAVIWVAGSLVTGGFWFARNLFEAGNPLPWADAGPLPGPDQFDIDIREPHNVADFLFDSTMITDVFIPKLNDSFGVLWPVVLAAVTAGFALAIWRGRTSMVRMLGVVALLSGVAYLFTPLTAAGPETSANAFDVNLRYASPALALGALLLAIDPVMSRERVQPWLIAGLTVLLAVGLFSGADSVWDRDFIPGAIVLAFLIVVVPAALILASRWGLGPVARARLGASAGAAIAFAIVVGWGAIDDYLNPILDADEDHRYSASTVPSDFPKGMEAALAWFNEEEPTDSRIAIVGGKPGFKQYIFYGDDLSNHVQYVAHHGPHGAYTPIAIDPREVADVEACEEWRTALNEGEYDYVVIGPDQRSLQTSPVEAVWTAAGSNLAPEVKNDLTFVYALEGELDPAACRAIDPSSPGYTVNQSKTAVGAPGEPVSSGGTGQGLRVQP